MSELNFVHLGTGYQLAGFADFESAFKATDKICGMGFRVAYLNEETHICEGEVMVYVLSCTTADAVKYRNYHFNRADAKLKIRIEGNVL